MDKFWIGAGAVAGLILFGFIIWTSMKIRKLENLTWKALEATKDEEIKNSIHAVSDAELDALLNKNIGRRDSKT